jgi:hypothetical protein
MGFCPPANTSLGSSGASLRETRSTLRAFYHPLTENCTLLAEFTDTRAEVHNGVENDSSNLNIGAFMSF